MLNLWRHFSPSRRSQERVSPTLPSPDAFRAMVQKERARADRSNGTFCLVAFDVGSAHSRDSLVSVLLVALRQRKRLTDEVGWSDDRHLAVILPDTTATGAECFAAAVSRAIAKTCAPPPYDVAEYPPASLRRNADPNRRAPQAIRPAASNGSAANPRTSSYSSVAPFGSTFPPLLGSSIPVWKRAFDILLSAVLLVCLLPLFLLIAVLILIVSPGPVLFAQERVGYLGKTFTIWKFRTMRVDADDTLHRIQVDREMKSEDPLTKLDSSHDPRVIPLGKWLRLTGLDELPQLFNVLQGEMSLIGPRPDPIYAVGQYQPWHAARVNVLPGITGLWQVSGKNRTTFKQMIRLDIAYSRQLSPFLDLKIALKTLPAIVALVRDSVSSRREGVRAAPSRWERRLPRAISPQAWILRR
jgi:lipopolysaccharide/colanic/teichoic acid biosynthesis glycosyltransferase